MDAHAATNSSNILACAPVTDMQRILLRPTTGIASTLEALSILRHFDRKYGREAFSQVQVFRVSI
jgi:hypothetical protein